MILRPYQKESIDSLRAGFAAGHKRQILAASTGSGKSVVMMSMIQSAINKGSRVLFVCERRILVDQFSKHLDSMSIDHGIYMRGSWRYRPHCDVQLASIQTLEKMEAWPVVDIIFVDEIHACMRKSLMTFMEKHQTIKICAATATPFHPEIPKYFTAVTSVITMNQLVQDKNLVPFKVFMSQEIDTSGLKVVAGEWKKDDLEIRGQQIVGDIVSDYVKLSSMVFGGFRKTICFSCGVAHGTDLNKRFNESGINAVQISYKDSDEFKQDVLREFAKQDTEIKVLISSTILERGFDQTDVEHVILARPLKKSFSSHVQMVGRGARSHHDKEFCVIQDHSGNWLRFQDDWRELFYNGVKDLQSCVADKKPKKEPTKEEKEAAKCPKCSHLWPAKSDICACCGFVRERRNDVVVNPGTLIELGNAARETADFQRSFYHQLLSIGHHKGYKEGWAYHKFKEKFGSYPKFEVSHEKPTKSVLNWVKSRQIAYAKAIRR